MSCLSKIKFTFLYLVLMTEVYSFLLIYELMWGRIYILERSLECHVDSAKRRRLYSGQPCINSSSHITWWLVQRSVCGGNRGEHENINQVWFQALLLKPFVLNCRWVWGKGSILVCGCCESGPMYCVHWRDRCDRTEERDGATGDGEENCSTVADMYRWSESPRGRSGFQIRGQDSKAAWSCHCNWSH